MKALILNSGMGTRMGDITKEHPKCMTELDGNETILSRQLKMLKSRGIYDIVITTGPFEEKLIEYCNSLDLGLNIVFVNNPVYMKTNYIYSMLIAKEQLNDDIVLLHGDLVFESSVINDILACDCSSVAAAFDAPLPEKDFKAVIDGDGYVQKIGIEFFDNAVAMQPLYKISKDDFSVWMQRIEEYCENGTTGCYAENAFNEVSDRCRIKAYDVGDRLCMEIDCIEDLNLAKERI